MHPRVFRLGLMVIPLLVACGRAVPGPADPAPVRSGLEVLVEDSLHLVRGVRVGLLSNQSGIDRHGTSGVELLIEAGVRLTTLYSPEHGFRGAAAPGEAVASSRDPSSGLPIYSLYGRTMTPTPEMLSEVDVLLVDLQDVGARYFTWLASTVEVMRAAATAGKRVLVLDRPNPIGGVVQGNVLDTAFASAVGRLAIPIRHGMTLGELARLAREDLGLTTDLGVVPAAGWRRAMTFDRTGLPLPPPSPNLRDLEALYHYPGLCLFEATALSVGRGTEAPFRQIGAPWLDTAAVLARVRAEGLEGVRFEGVRFTPGNPGDGKFADSSLTGIRLITTDPSRYDPVLTALILLEAIGAVHPTQIGYDPPRFDRLAGGPVLREALLRGQPPREITASWVDELARFTRRRTSALLYP